MNDAQREYLIKNGVDLESAMNYTGDEEMYNEILLDFYNNLDNQFAELKSYINDMPNYAIYVHALKSNARTLGIKFLADVCYQHEMESKASNQAFVISNMNLLEINVSKTKALIEGYKNL